MMMMMMICDQQEQLTEEHMLLSTHLNFRTLLLVLSPERQNLLTSLPFLNLYTGSK